MIPGVDNGGNDCFEDDLQNDEYYKGLVKRWGVKEEEFDCRNCQPRVWLHDMEQAQRDHDGWYLSPWALAYYDRYPEELEEDSKVRNCYERSMYKPRIERFMDTKEVTLAVIWGGRHFISVSLSSEVLEEDLDVTLQKRQTVGDAT